MANSSRNRLCKHSQNLLSSRDPATNAEIKMRPLLSYIWGELKRGYIFPQRKKRNDTGINQAANDRSRKRGIHGYLDGAKLAKDLQKLRFCSGFFGTSSKVIDINIESGIRVKVWKCLGWSVTRKSAQIWICHSR
jgi:hypothetical protein